MNFIEAVGYIKNDSSLIMTIKDICFIHLNEVLGLMHYGNLEIWDRYHPSIDEILSDKWKVITEDYYKKSRSTS